MITMNVGVMDPDVYRISWGSEPSTFVQEPACIVRSRIGFLVGNTDRWWQIDDDKSANEIVDAAIRFGVPFLGRLHSPKSMITRLESQMAALKRYPLTRVYYAVLQHQVGHKKNSKGNTS